MMKTTVLAASLAAIGSVASATTVTTDTNAGTLAAATLATNSGITIQSGTETLTGSATQQGTYTGFTGGTASIEDGVVLTTGNATATTNTSTNAGGGTGTGSYAPLVTLAGDNGLSTTQNDANVLSYSFILDDVNANAVTGQFIFATEEFPTQSVTDIMGIFVNGVNYAFFPNGDLVSNQSGDSNGFFFTNTPGDSVYDYGQEWNGFTTVYTFTGLALGGGQVNTIAFAVSDTSDTGWNSALYVANLQSITTTSSTGGIGEASAVPLPAAGWMLLAGLGGLAAARRRRKA